MDVTQALDKSVCRDRDPEFAICLGDRRRCASGSRSCYFRENVAWKRGRYVDANLRRWISNPKRQQGRVEMLVQLADETVAASNLAAGWC